MKNALFALLLCIASLGAQAQGGGTGQGWPTVLYYTNSVGGTITATNANCLAVAQTACVYLQVPQGAATASMVITGTWSGTLQFETTPTTAMNYNQLDSLGMWTSAASATSNGTTTITVGNQTWVRVRASAWSSGTANIVLIVSTNPALPPSTNVTLSLAQTFTAANTFSGGVINTTTPIRDTTQQVLAAAMTATSAATVAIGSTGSGNAAFTWPVTAANWYDLHCKFPVTFVASATVNFQLYAISGSPTISFVNTESSGNTAGSAAFQDVYTTGSSLATTTTTTGAPGAVSEMVTVDFQFLSSHSGNIGIEFSGNTTNNVTLLEGGKCGITQIN
jgi:hypothetical protein